MVDGIPGRGQGIHVGIADWDDPKTHDLVAAHYKFFTGIEANSTFSRPPTLNTYSCKLQAPDTVLFVACAGDQLLGCGALRTVVEHTTNAGEIVSMHTLAESRGKGVGLAILRHIEHVAREAGLARLYIETGKLDGYTPARKLYHRAGFRECGLFAEYGEHADVFFMVKEL